MKKLGCKEIIHYLVQITLLICILINFSYGVRINSRDYSEDNQYVKTKIRDPETVENIFPDTLIWSKGGEIKYGLKLMIGCNKISRVYKPGELIGIRTGIQNCSDSNIFLACAFYSPNKHGGYPPEYTLLIDAPENFHPERRRYLDDDCLSYPGKPQLIKVPNSMIFNPSPDKFYYNSSNGILKFNTPGLYKMWCSYTLDSISSNIKIDKTITIYSDTIDIVIKPRSCLGFF